MRKDKTGNARFICPNCGYAVAATWRKRTQLYEGRCIRCEKWAKYRKQGEPAVPLLE